MRPPGYYTGMDPDDVARSKANDANAAQIAQRRREMAARLRAPAGPALAVRAAWQALRTRDTSRTEPPTGK